MEFGDYLKEQIKRHPVMQPQDVVKMCYQAAFGAEHLLTDVSRAKAYFEKEYAVVPAKDMVLYETISAQVCRINLCAWKQTGMPPEWLWRMFADTASAAQGSRELFLEYLKEAQRVAEQGGTGFTCEQWEEFMAQYEAAGMPAVHHSQEYREAEQPAYRIVKGAYVRILPVLQQAAAVQQEDGMEQKAVLRQAAAMPQGVPLQGTMEQHRTRIIAIDGRAAAGKTTMCQLLEKVLDAGVVHMDDFFLPPHLRSDSRLAEAGGNVHYERFAKEVLPWVGTAEGFSYRIFDCRTMNYEGHREVKASGWRVVEGSYSTHPAFGEYADVKVFLDVEPKEQMKRIVRRNGENMARMFEDRWIPLEEAYFDAFQVKETADMVICSRE